MGGGGGSMDEDRLITFLATQPDKCASFALLQRLRFFKAFAAAKEWVAANPRLARVGKNVVLVQVRTTTCMLRAQHHLCLPSVPGCAAWLHLGLIASMCVCIICTPVHARCMGSHVCTLKQARLVCKVKHFCVPSNPVPHARPVYHSHPSTCLHSTRWRPQRLRPPTMPPSLPPLPPIEGPPAPPSSSSSTGSSSRNGSRGGRPPRLLLNSNSSRGSRQGTGAGNAACAGSRSLRSGCHGPVCGQDLLLPALVFTCIKPLTCTATQQPLHLCSSPHANAAYLRVHVLHAMVHVQAGATAARGER